MGGLAKMGVTESWRNMERGLNDAVSGSFVGRYFKLEARGSCFTRELRAGTATFLTMAYIITVNATIVSDSGGTCPVPDASSGGNSTTDDAYEDCVAATRSDLVTATIISAMLGSLAMGLLANLPFGLAPAMGPNAYLAYNMVGLHGSGPIPYRTGLAVVLVEGCIFLALSVSGLRARLVRLIPRSVRLACAVGIGLFIAFVGLQAQQGVGLVGPDASTLVTIAACAKSDPDTGACLGGRMRDPKFWLAATGFVITAYGLMKQVKGSMMFGILFVTLVSWFRGTSVTIFPDTPSGNTSYRYFQKIIDFHKIESTMGAISFAGFNDGPVWVALATLLYVDVLATTGTLYTLAELGGYVDDESGGFEGEYVAYIVDAGSTVVGSALGVATTATYVESSAGMREGGRTGLTAVVVGLYFMASLFFTPLLTNVPPWAIGPSLVMVGVMMMGVVKDIDWSNVREAVPAFVTILLMPLTYSIANGIIAGIGLYIVLGLYDYVAGLVGRFNSLRKVVVSEQNQVSTVEII